MESSNQTIYACYGGGCFGGGVVVVVIAVTFRNHKGTVLWHTAIHIPESMSVVQH